MSFDHGHALVIGVNNYPNVPGLNVAQTRADAEAVAAVLRYQQFCGYPESQVTLLVDIGATRGAILGALDALAGMVSDSDTVLLFYAGHGMYGADGAYYLSSSDVQIAPVDGKSKVVGGTGVSEAELITKLRAIKAQRVLLIFNACHSGAVSPTLGVEQQAPAGRNPPNETTAALLATGAGRIIITACRAAQYSYIGTGALTLFTQALVSGLLGQGVSGRNGYISAFDLYTHIYTTVSETVKNDYRGIQEPELTILKGVGPFAVALYRGATTLGAFDERAAPTPGVAVRPVSEDESRRAFERIVSVGQGVASGGDLTGGTVIGGNQTNAQGSQGFIGQATGPISQNFGSQQTVNTGGGDYAAGNIDKRQGGTAAVGRVRWVSTGVADPPHLNTRFDGIKPDQPLPVGRRVPFVVWVSSRIESNRSQSSRPFTFAFLDSTEPVVFTVRLRADPDAWIIEPVKPTLIVAPPGQTTQEAVFLVTARRPGREKLYITVERTTGVVVQDIWLTVDAALDTEESRLARWLRAILRGPLRPWFAPRAPLSDAQAPTAAEPLAAVRPADAVDLDSSVSPRDQQAPSAAFTQSLVSTSRAPLAPMFGAALTGAAQSPPPADTRREVALPLDTREVQQRTVRMTFQQAGHDASAFNVFVSAQLPDGWLYRDYRIPVSGAEIQNATLRLRHELERIVFYHVREGGGASYPFAALDALTVDEGTARQASVPLADVGQQVWSMLFDGPRTPDELRRVAAGLRDLPHGSSLQVVLDNQQFIVPWALLYDMPGPITAETLDWSGFWGYRYRLDVLTPGQYPEPTIADDPIRLQLLFNDSAELRGFTSAQAEFVRQQLSKAHCAVAWGMEEFEQVLRNPGEATLWYCYCHGTHTGGAVQPHALASESALTFSSGQRLRLADLRRMRPARLSSRPLIFINACEGATQDAFYYDGFMPFFIEERGARGFIGTEVKAPQFLGHDFALEFLRAFARGQEVGEILWRLRRHYLETHHNILAFNYSLYGLGEVRLATPLLAQPRS